MLPITAKSVTEITAYLRQLLERDPLLQSILIEGEISNFTRAASGHLYFSLKDAQAQLRCVMWKSSATRQPLDLKNGQSIQALGHISLYEPRGEYQLVVEAIRPVGIGDLYERLERLKAKLAAEGLFDKDRKRAIPSNPQVIGIVTSPTAAAYQDILNVLRRRYPLAQIILSPTPVQGIDAPPQIIHALHRLNQRPEVEIILICRGGGSIEDLWAFNDEQVARAIANSRIPVITGVGHETDFTLVDFVSDLRAPTPSAAAELATPDIMQWRQDLRLTTERLDGMMLDAIIERSDSVTALRQRLDYQSPQRLIQRSRQRIDELEARMASSQRRYLALRRERLAVRLAALRAANPEALLARGYAMLFRTDDGQRIVSTLDIKPGMGIKIQVKDGAISARVEDEETHGRYKRTLF